MLITSRWRLHQSPPLRLLAEEKGYWDGTASELLRELEAKVSIDARRTGWPKGAQALSGILRRLAPNLRLTGIDVRFYRSTDSTRERTITIYRCAPVPADASEPSEVSEPA